MSKTPGTSVRPQREMDMDAAAILAAIGKALFGVATVIWAARRKP